MSAQQNFPTVSMVRDAESTATRDANPVHVLKRIKSGKWRVSLESIRSKYSHTLKQTGDPKAAKLSVDAMKRALPGALWSGAFTTRQKDIPLHEKLIAHSGLVCADLDELGERLADVRSKLTTSPHCWACFVSPTGSGLKAVFRVRADAAQHAASFRAIERHVQELTGVEIDPACRDIGRLCFVSSDPGAYLNEGATELPPLAEATQKTNSHPSNGAPDGSSRRDIAAKLLGEIEWETATKGYCVCPGKHLHTTSDGAKDFQVCIDGAPTVFCLHSHCVALLRGINHELRSLVARAEFVPTPAGSVTSDEGPAALDELRAYRPPPLELLPPALQDYAHAAAKSLGVDVGLVLPPLLSGLGAAIGNSRVIQLKDGFTQPPIIWTCVVGRSGHLKTPALETAVEAFHQRERELIKRNKEERIAFQEKMAEWEGASRENRGPKPTPPPRLTALADDLTLAALGSILADNPRGVLVKKDELSHWFQSFDQYSKSDGADVSRWLSLHSGVPFALDRKTNGESLRIFDPRVCITGGIQPRTLKTCLTEDYFARGLPARILFSYPPERPAQWSESVIPAKVRQGALDIFQRLFALQPNKADGEEEPALVSISPEAKELYVGFYNTTGAVSSEADDREAAAWNKMSGYAARLALIGHLAGDNSGMVSAKTMEAAVALAQWFGQEAARVYRLLVEPAENNLRRRLLEFVANRQGSVTVRDVITNFWPLKNQTKEAEAALVALVKAGKGIWQDSSPGSTGGKPTRRFVLPAEVDPHLHLHNPRKTEEFHGFADADAGECLGNGSNTAFMAFAASGVPVEKEATGGVDSSPEPGVAPVSELAELPNPTPGKQWEIIL